VSCQWNDRPSGSTEDGMTMVEVIVAAAILLVVATSVFAAMFSGLRLQGSARQRQTGSFWAERLMEQARSKPYEAIGLKDSSAAMAAAAAAVPAGDPDHPDRLLRQDGATNCLEVNTGSAAAPRWERLVLSDWNRTPAEAAACSTHSTDSNLQLDHAGASNDHVDPATSLAFHGWVFVSWAAVEGHASTYYKRVTVLVRHPSQNGAVSRTVRLSSVFSLGYVPPRTTPAGATTTSAPTTTTVAGTTTTSLPTGCAYKPGDTQAPAGRIDLSGAVSYTNQTTVTINNSVSDLPNGSGASGMATMQFSSVGASGPWLPVTGTAYATVFSGWSLSSGDGVKQVWGRFTDCNGNAVVLDDTITLDQTRPPALTLTAWARNRNSIDLSWTASVDPGGTAASGTARYRVYRLDLGTTIPLQEVTDTSLSDNSVAAGQAYTYWVTAVDQAGNESQPESNHATATPS
jgi:Tfp pilus assembly protein PilV